jgi:hypothetical protein
VDSKHTAAELKTLAELAVHELWTEPNAPDLGAHVEETVLVYGGPREPWDSMPFGVTIEFGGNPDRDDDPVFELVLTPKNTASREALRRALVASAVTVADDTGRHYEDDVTTWYAILGDQQAEGGTEAEAVDALLDALLGVNADA